MAAIGIVIMIVANTDSSIGCEWMKTMYDAVYEFSEGIHVYTTANRIWIH